MTLSGALRDAVPFQCRKGFPNYEQHRQEWSETVRTRLYDDNKRLVKIRFLADGWVADWEEMHSMVSTSQGNCISPVSMGRVQPQEVPQAAIGRMMYNPIDLTFWDDEKDTKMNPMVVEPEPDTMARMDTLPTNPSLAVRQEPGRMTLDEDDKDHRQSPMPMTRPTLSQRSFHDPPVRPLSVGERDTHYDSVVHRPPPRTPTGPRYHRPYRDEPERSSRRDYAPYRDPPYTSFPRDGSRRRQESSWSRRREDTRRRDDYTSYSDRRRTRYRSPSPDRRREPYHRRLEYLRGSDAGERGRHEQREALPVAPTSSAPPVEVRTPQPDGSSTPQIDLAEQGLLPSFSNVSEDDEIPFPPEGADAPQDQDMLNEELVDPNIEGTHSQDEMQVDSSAPLGESQPKAQNSESSSEEEESSEENETLPVHATLLHREAIGLRVPDAQQLLASINLAAIKDVMNTPTVAPTAVVQPPPMRRPVEREPFNTAARNKGHTEKKPARPLSAPTKDPPKPSTSQSASKRSNTKAVPPRISMRYKQAETVRLPKPDYARARRILAPSDQPLVCISMPGDIQFIRNDERTRVEGWSLPAPPRSRDEAKTRSYVVTDACLLGDSSVLMVHETGPHPASLVCLPNENTDVPVRYDLSHPLVPASSDQRRHILSRVCAIDNQRFITGCMDKRILLWNVHDVDDGPPSIRSGQGGLKVSIDKLDISHAAPVRALTFSSSRDWLVSAAGAKLAVTDIVTGKSIVQASKQKWASSDVFNLHFHTRDRNMLLVETGDLDKQARIYDLRKIHQTEVAPEILLGSTETSAIPQFNRGDWAKSLFVRPSSQNMVKVWDIRKPDKVLSEHTLSHAVTHCIFMDDCRTIAATGEHFVTFLDARA